LLEPGARHLVVFVGPELAWTVKVTIKPVVLALVTATDNTVLGAR
jgi:hypothetical protein